MVEEEDFETYLLISKNKFQIFVFDIKNSKNLFNNEAKFEDLDNLKDFLDVNIFKIEKLVSNFVRDIFIIIEADENLNVNICVKKKDYNEKVNRKNLERLLIEAKDLLQENYPNHKIMHMIIDNYIIDEKKYSTFTNDMLSNELCLEINFSLISNDLILSFEKTLEKYQIKISKFLSVTYVKNFFNYTELELSEMIFKIKSGYNSNEVLLVPKNDNNKGFFEKFFQLFG